MSSIEIIQATVRNNYARLTKPMRDETSWIAFTDLREFEQTNHYEALLSELYKMNSYLIGKYGSLVNSAQPALTN